MTGARGSLSVRFRDTWRVSVTSSNYVIVLEDSRPEESKQSDLHDLYVCVSHDLLFECILEWTETRGSRVEWLVLFTWQTILEHTAKLLVQANNISRKNMCIRVANIYDFKDL